MKSLSLWTLVLSFCLTMSTAIAQPWTYDFGTATAASFTSSTFSTTFLPTPTNGTARVRVGANPGSIALANPGVALGSSTELQITTNTGSASTTKFSVFDYTAAKVGYARFNIAFSTATAGAYQFCIGDGLSFSDNNALAVAQTFAGIQWTFGASNLITYRVLNAATYGTIGITTSTTAFVQGVSNDYLVEIYANNETTTQNYYRAASSASFSLAAGTWDLWIGGIQVGNDLAKGNLAANVNFDSFAINHQTSVTAPGTLYLDNFEYSNALPAAPICTAPSTQASAITFSGVTSTEIAPNWTNGNGAGRVAYINSTNTFTAPSTGDNPTTDLSWNGAGQQPIFNGTGSGPVTVTGLTPSNTYHVRVYEYCSPDRVYQTATATGNPNSTTTSAGTGLSASALAAFGNQCVSITSAGQSFTITGTSLTAANVAVGPFGGYTFSTTETGTYTSNLSLTQPGGAYTQDIWVKFTPVAITTYNGNIPVSGGGASSIDVAVTGTGVAGVPALSTPTSASITSTTAILGGNITSIGCSSVTTRGIFWSLTNGFADGAGTEVSSTGTFGTGVFTVNATVLPSNSTIYFKVFATNGNGTTYSTQQTFNTLQFFLNVGDLSIIGWNSNVTDNFAFVPWVALPNNVVIKFTDGGFNGTAPNSENTAGNARGSEQFVIWRNNTGSPIVAGTVITISGITANVGIATGGSGSGLNGGLAVGGDQIFAYQGSATTGTTPDYSGTGAAVNFSGDMLFGLHYPGNAPANTWLTTGSVSSTTSYLPTELNVANANITFGAAPINSVISHGQYTATRVAQATFAGYKAFVANPANWTTGTGNIGTATLSTTPFVESLQTATKVAVTNINSGVTPTQGQPFSISFETRDGLDVGSPVIVNTTFAVSVFTGTGTLTGTLTGTILAGNSSLTLGNLIYDVSEGNVVLTVAATAGDVLDPGNSAAFTVAPPASQLTLIGVQTFAYTSNNLATFTVEARRSDNSIDPAYSANVTIELFSGTGALIGTLVKPSILGVATFNGISIDTPGVKTIRATSGILTDAVSANITVSTVSVTDLIVPQFMQGRNGTNSNRIPVAYRVRINGLEANKTFRYYSLMDTLNNSTTGAGVVYIANQTGNFTKAPTGSFTVAGEYGEFTSDVTGSYTSWFITEPSANDRFTPGKNVYGRILINDPSQGTGVLIRVSTNNTIKVLEVGTGALQGTAIRGNSSATAKNFISMFDNTAGLGRPISCTFVESDGAVNTTNYASFYSGAVNGVAGAYGSIIPNTLPNGIRRIEQRSLETGFFVSCPVTDNDGIWPSGANTVNSNTGTTAKVISATDAPFLPTCVFITAGNNDNFLNANISSTSGGSFPGSNCFNNTLVGSGVSAEGSPLNVLPLGGQDRWYAVVAPSSVLRVICTTTAFNAVLELHASNGALIDTQNIVAGVGGETMITTGLTVGLYYFVAVRSFDGTLGNFSVCLQAILASQPANPSSTLNLCSNFKPTWTGANTYTVTFTGTGATPVGPTQITVPGQVALSTPSLALRYGGTYNVRVDANYTGLSEPVTVQGTIAAITIAAHAVLDTKETQKCPSTLLRGSILSGKPFVCTATSFTVSFQRVSACVGGTYVDAFPFEVNTPGTSSNLFLNFTSPQPLVAQSWYEVRWRPNFGYGSGTFGTPSIIFIGGSVIENIEALNELVAETQKIDIQSAQANLYPNPNKGEMFNINLTDITSNEVFVRVMDTMGRVVYNNRYSVDGTLNTIVSFNRPLTAGMYMVEFSVNGGVITERMIVNQ